MTLEEFINQNYSKIKIVDKKIISSQTNGYIGKNIMEVKYADGITKTFEQITKNKGKGNAVIIVPVTKDNKYVIIFESRPNTKSGVNLSFPAGMIDENESPLNAAMRELREETGYEAEEIIPLEWHYQDQGCSEAVISTFLAKNCIKKYEKKLDENERIEIFEATSEEIEREMNNPNNDNFKDSGSKIAYQYALKYRK